MRLSELAAKAKRDPWVLTADDGSALVTIAQPTCDAFWVPLDAAESVADVLRVVTGDQYDALMAALGPLPAPALKAVADDIREAFGLGNSEG